MRRARRVSLRLVGVAALTLGVILGGCGRTSTTVTAKGARTSTATLSATATATTTTASAGLPISAGCPAMGLTPTRPQYVAVGVLSVSIPVRVSDYPNALIPNNQPKAPYQVPLTKTVAEQAAIFHPDPPVNPSLKSGYAIQVCNQTGASHSVTDLGVTIANFTPSSGPVNVWHLCGDGPYDSATKLTTTGCGGGMGEVVFMAASLPEDRTGATAVATANAQMPGGTNLPVAIGPNQSLIFVVAVNGLASQGTYALSFGVGVDGAAATTVAPGDGSFLIAPSAAVWTGTDCQTSAMLAQIPASSQDTYYVCPPAS